MTSVCQPMDMGIIANLKLNYKNYLARAKNMCLENNLKFCVNVLDAMTNLKKSWEDVKSSTIQNCFKKAQFNRDLKEKIPTEIELEYIQDQLPSFDDDFLQVCDEAGSCNILINDENDESSEDEDEDENISIPIINSSIAIRHLQELSNFLLKNNCDVMEVHNLKSIVFDAIDFSKQQTKITDFFSCKKN